MNLDGVSPSLTNVTFDSSTISQQGSGGTLQLANGATLTVAADSTATISAPVALRKQRNLESECRQPIDDLRRGQRRGRVADRRQFRHCGSQRCE